jgi:hypothetical protein
MILLSICSGLLRSHCATRPPKRSTVMGPASVGAFPLVRRLFFVPPDGRGVDWYGEAEMQFRGPGGGQGNQG